MQEEVKNRAKQWLLPEFDEATRTEVQVLLNENSSNLIDAFYKDLEFGTGGLRGIMGVGTNRMNIYTVGMATQGLCNYLLEAFAGLPQIKVVIAHDCRNNGPLFAQTAANVFSANGIKVYVFDSLRPTPELSFAIRHLGCQSGIVITASHNPKEYNGYKAYWDDGAQLVPPHDDRVVEEARKITSLTEVKFNGNPALIESIGNEIDEIYLSELTKLVTDKKAITQNKDFKIVYTPIHGTGVKLVPELLKRMGFVNVYHVDAQDETDGNFPTVKSPNPENAEALTMAIARAKETGAELVMATDPDSDRVGIAVRDAKGEFVLLNGNQTGTILFYYLLKQNADKKLLKGNEYVVKTIVTTELLAEMANHYNVKYYDVLTGFKYIAEIIRENPDKRFLIGAEESYGYLNSTMVRDKDAIMACGLIAEVAAWAKSQGKSLLDLLYDVYVEFSLYVEDLVNITKTGKSGADEIKQMMHDYREAPPTELDGSLVTQVLDYENSLGKNLITGKTWKLEYPKSDVLQFQTLDGTKVSVRPSGTEPKIKFYFSVKKHISNRGEVEPGMKNLKDKINRVKKDLGI